MMENILLRITDYIFNLKIVKILNFIRENPIQYLISKYNNLIKLV